MDIDRKKYLENVKRIVVKVGSSTLTYSNGHLNLNRIESLVRQLSDIHNQGIEVILVTSGAVGAGMGRLGLKEKPRTIPEKQAAAAVGQGLLMHMYEKIFAEYGKIAAQILLTREDMNHRVRFLNARNVLFDLLGKGVIPIINENDAVVVEEIKFGDNDTLSAIVASIVEADLLIILSDINGLYDSNPSINPDAKLIDFIDKISEEIEALAGDTVTKVGTGGMITKLRAAKIVMQSGINMVIANGSTPGILRSVLNFENTGTLFKAKNTSMHSRKKWLAFGTKVFGKITVDNGAASALKARQSSLLASGITDVEGSFYLGSVVRIVDDRDREIGRGIANYSSEEISLIKGIKSCEIEGILGYKNYDEVVHRDNIVITGGEVK